MMYTFLSKVLILLDVTPDQSLLSEGVAREVVNRIQKLRKKVTSQYSTVQEPVCSSVKLVSCMCNESHIGVIFKSFVVHSKLRSMRSSIKGNIFRKSCFEVTIIAFTVDSIV